MLIRIVDVSADRNRVSYRLAYSGSVRKYLLQDTFFAEYDPRIDTARIDQSILAIPVVSMLAPIAWAIGADVEVASLDEAYVHSLQTARNVLTQWFPRFSTSGTINVRNVTRNQFGGTRTALLFSGGLDAVTSYTKHKDDKPDLVSVWCIDPRLHEEDKWAYITKAARTLAERDSAESLSIRSDLTYFNERLLNYEFGLFSWYGQVAHGLLLLSLCAPITAVRTIGRVLIASSSPEGQLEPWGSHPSIDNHVSWADVIAVHDAIDMSRHQKMKYMCATSRDSLANLKVCHIAPVNCSRCEKCYRTIVGLCIEGVDPRDCGFQSDQKTLASVRKAILAGKMPSGMGETMMWTDLQKYVPEHPGTNVIGSRDFFRWLKQYDFTRLRISRVRRGLWQGRLRLLRLSANMRSFGRMRHYLRFLVFLAVCSWHTVLFRGRRAATSILPFRRSATSKG